MHHFVFLPYLVDLVLWMNPILRPRNGFNCYSYVLIYVYDVIGIQHDARYFS